MGNDKCQVSHAFLLLPTAVMLIYLGAVKGSLPAGLLFHSVFVGQEKNRFNSCLIFVFPPENYTISMLLACFHYTYNCAKPKYRSKNVLEIPTFPNSPSAMWLKGFNQVVSKSKCRGNTFFLHLHIRQTELREQFASFVL